MGLYYLNCGLFIFPIVQYLCHFSCLLYPWLLYKMTSRIKNDTKWIEALPKIHQNRPRCVCLHIPGQRWWFIFAFLRKIQCCKCAGSVYIGGNLVTTPPIRKHRQRKSTRQDMSLSTPLPPPLIFNLFWVLMTCFKLYVIRLGVIKALVLCVYVCVCVIPWFSSCLLRTTSCTFTLRAKGLRGLRKHAVPQACPLRHHRYRVRCAPEDLTASCCRGRDNLPKELSHDFTHREEFRRGL